MDTIINKISLENGCRVLDLFLAQEKSRFTVIARESTENERGAPNSRVGHEERSYFDDKDSAEKFFNEMREAFM